MSEKIERRILQKNHHQYQNSQRIRNNTNSMIAHEVFVEPWKNSLFKEYQDYYKENGLEKMKEPLTEILSDKVFKLSRNGIKHRTILDSTWEQYLNQIFGKNNRTFTNKSTEDCEATLCVGDSTISLHFDHYNSWWYEDEESFNQDIQKYQKNNVRSVYTPKSKPSIARILGLTIENKDFKTVYKIAQNKSKWHNSLILPWQTFPSPKNSHMMRNLDEKRFRDDQLRDFIRELNQKYQLWMESLYCGLEAKNWKIIIWNHIEIMSDKIRWYTYSPISWKRKILKEKKIQQQ